MEALEKDFEDLVESEDNQEKDDKFILDYFDDEGNIISEKEETEVPETTEESQEEDTSPDSLTSEEFQAILQEWSDEDLESLPDEFFADIPEDLLAEVKLTKEDLPEGETDLQELYKTSLGKRLQVRKKPSNEGTISEKRLLIQKQKVAELYSSFEIEEEALRKKALGTRMQDRKDRVKYLRTAGGKKYLVKQKKRNKKIASGSMRVDKNKSVKQQRVARLYNEYNPTEDVNALLSGEEFSEEFKTKASTIFESAVNKRVEEELKINLLLQHEEMLEESVDALNEVQEEITSKLDSYLDYIVEEWLEDNKIAVESGIKTEVTENFLSGLKALFESSYVDIPEEKVDVFGELTEKTEELQKTLDQQIQTNVELKEENEKYLRDDIFLTVSDGMVDTDVEKLKTLVESVSYSGDIEDYTQKLETIKENYFNKSSEEKESGLLTEETDDSTYGTSDPIMSAYATALGRYSK